MQQVDVAVQWWPNTTLTYDDFYKVEQILGLAIKDYNSGIDDDEKLYLEEYKRQYLPVIRQYIGYIIYL